MRSRVDAAVAITVAAVALAVYTRTLAPSVLPGDSGEFQFAAYLLSVAHPTGYPLYLILGKLFSLAMPVGDVAYRLNLLSAVLGAGAVAVTYLAGRQLGARPLPSAAAALALAFSATFWSQATRAEVYALNSLLVAGVTAATLAATRQQEGSSRPARAWAFALAAAALFGLGLAHHRTIILLAPALAIYLWLRRSSLGWLTVRRRAILAAVAAAPLLLYLYVPLRAPATPYFRLTLAPGSEIVAYDGSLEALLRLLSGQSFQGQLALDGMAERVAMAWGLLVQQYTAAGLALAALGAIWLLRRRPAALSLIGLGYAAVAAFCLAYRIGDIADLFTPSYLFVAMGIAAGGEAVLRAAERALPRLPARAAGAALLLSLPALLAWTGFPAEDRGGDATRQAWEAVLSEPLARNAVLVTNDRDEMMPLWYLQYVENRRPDLLGLFALITGEPAYANVMRLLDTVVPTGRPVYLIKDMPGLDLRYDYQREGSLFRVTGAACTSQPQRPAPADLQGQVRLLGADVGAASSLSCGKIAGVPESGSAAGPRSVTVTLYWEGTGRASRDLQSFVHVLDGAGNKVAQSDHRPGGVYYPTSMWQAGEVLRDAHTLSVPAGGPYRLVCGMYRGDTLSLVGDAVSLGELAP